MKNKKILIGIIIFLVVAVLVFFVLGFFRKGPRPQDGARISINPVVANIQ